jgi:hypothetical protein
MIALIAALAVAVGLTAMGARGQTSSDDEADQSGPIPAATASAKPYLLFQAVGTGTETDSSGGCSDVECPSKVACDCIIWTTLPFSSTALGNGTFTAHLNLDLTSASQIPIPTVNGECYAVAGVGKLSTSTNNAIALNIAGTACDVASPNSKLQFSGSYTVTGGIGSYATSNGVGNATATMANETGTYRVAWTLSGTISK